MVEKVIPPLTLQQIFVILALKNYNCDVKIYSLIGKMYKGGSANGNLVKQIVEGDGLRVSSDNHEPFKNLQKNLKPNGI